MTLGSWIVLAALLAAVVGMPLALDSAFGSVTSSQQIMLVIIVVGLWIGYEIRRAPIRAEKYREWRRMLRKKGLGDLPDDLAQAELHRRAAKAWKDYEALQVEHERQRGAGDPWAEGEELQRALTEYEKLPKTPRKRE